MVRDKGLNFDPPPLFSAVVLVLLYSPWGKLCRAQRNPCETFGICGAFGVCNRQESPICGCLQGFNPQNNQEWNSGNWSSGCVRRVPLNCEAANNRTTDDGFLNLKMIKLANYSDMWPGPQTQCGDRCLRNCSCLAYGYDFNVGCVFWNRPLIDLQSFAVGAATDLNVRVSTSELEKKKGSKKIIIILVVVGLFILSISIFSYWIWIRKHRGPGTTVEFTETGSSGRVDNSRRDALSRVRLEDLPLIEFEILANATNNFSEANKLGKGGFGPVYKGELVDGREIAVKRLAEASGQGMQEFVNEVVLISKLQHRNLVKLLGFCVEDKETMLIYEYMPRKSLDFYLFDQTQVILDWRKRFNIIEGICRGLLYLHRDSRLKIIHRDLKPSNILLDNDWNAKISDFGTARIFGTKQDHVSTARVVGTYGYLAPEYAMEGRFSEKSDVFSLGVLIIEIAIGRRNTGFYDQDDALNLLGHVRKLWTEENVASLIDPRISSSSNRGEVLRCIHIGLLCVQELPKDRPSVSTVLSMLSSEIIELPEPKESAFTIAPTRPDVGTTSSQQSNLSVNNLTITQVDGR